VQAGGRSGNGAGVSVKTVDMNADASDEVVLSNAGLELFLSPQRGGSLVEIDWKERGVNLSNTLSRWYEGYHAKLKAACAGHKGTGDEGSKSIHDMVVTKEKGLEKYLLFDTARRASLRERFLEAGAGLEALMTSRAVETGDFHDSPYDARVLKDGVSLSRESSVGAGWVRLSKEIRLTGRSAFKAAYRVESAGAAGGGHAPLNLKLSVEFNLCTPGCNGPGSYYEFRDKTHGNARKGLDARESLEDVSAFSIVDGFAGLRVDFTIDRKAALFVYPIETVSLSEAGFERNYQGSCITLLVPVTLPLEEALTFDIGVDIKPVQPERGARGA